MRSVCRILTCAALKSYRYMLYYTFLYTYSWARIQPVVHIFGKRYRGRPLLLPQSVPRWNSQKSYPGIMCIDLPHQKSVHALECKKLPTVCNELAMEHDDSAPEQINWILCMMNGLLTSKQYFSFLLMDDAMTVWCHDAMTVELDWSECRVTRVTMGKDLLQSYQMGQVHFTGPCI